MTPRIALLGFSIECNRFAPIATEADFQTRTLIVLMKGNASSCSIVPIRTLPL